jgi:hypothetical protein
VWRRSKSLDFELIRRAERQGADIGNRKEEQVARDDILQIHPRQSAVATEGIVEWLFSLSSEWSRIG